MMKKSMILGTIAIVLSMVSNNAIASDNFQSKPSPDEALKQLKDGNDRFANEEAEYPHLDRTRMQQTAQESQGKHAFATVISCSDSRVPPELLFDAGLMDLFVIRVAGNVCDTDEIGSIEYGLGHVNTPVLVVLGHNQCGAVTAVVNALKGESGPIERNIPELVDNIIPAVKRVMVERPYLSGDALVTVATEENVWQSIEDLFKKSPATRDLVNQGKVKVVGAIYDLASGKVYWLPENKVDGILASVEQSADKETVAFVGGDSDASSHTPSQPAHETTAQSDHSSFDQSDHDTTEIAATDEDHGESFEEESFEEEADDEMTNEEYYYTGTVEEVESH